MNFGTDLKKALELLPSEEKDKLILRLLKRDLVLANRFQFELVSTESIKNKKMLSKRKFKNQFNVLLNGFILVDIYCWTEYKC